MRNEIHTKRGRLTAYGFACGYVESYGSNQTQLLSLWREHNAFHVRQHNFTEGKRVFWESFDRLDEARARFGLAKKMMKAKQNPKPVEVAGV